MSDSSSKASAPTGIIGEEAIQSWTRCLGTGLQPHLGEANFGSTAPGISVNTGRDCGVARACCKPPTRAAAWMSKVCWA